MNYQATRFCIAREAWPFAVPVALAAFVAGWLRWPLLATVFGIVCIYIIAFFRNPQRNTPDNPAAIIAPADGKIVAAGIVSHPDFEGGQALRIAVFMSLFNVHINWSPCEAEVLEASHYPGRFLNAMEDKCSEENERKVLKMRSACNQAPLVVKLVAGLVARRIVCPVQGGDRLGRGEKIGLIRFGSRVEVLLPANSVLQVSLGMHVRGGQTILALLESADAQQVRANQEAYSTTKDC